jgi:hypothetical protein
MKYIALTIGVVGILPLAIFLRSNPYARSSFWVLVGIIPFVSRIIPFFDIAIITWHEFWWGHVPALQISAIDLIAIALYFTIRHQKNSIRYHFPFLLYLTAISLSVFQADLPLGAFFYVWQFIRTYFLTVVIAKACTDEAVPLQLLKGMAIGLAIQFIVVIYQKLGLRIVQPTGTFYHQNTLGLITHLVVFPHFALLLAGQSQLRNAAVSFFGFVIVSLIASRAALGFAAFGFGAAYCLSSIRRWTSRKALIGMAGAMTMAAMAPIAFSSLDRRFDLAPLIEHEYDERAAFNRTALSMLATRPLGVGANHYSYVGKNYGFSIGAGVAPNEGSLNNIVHNAYLLNAAEAGYLGFVAFTLLSLYPIWVAMRYSWLRRGDPKADLLLGLGVAMLTISIHSLFEYIIVNKDVQSVLAIVVGMTLGLAHQLKSAGKARPIMYRRTVSLEDRAGWRLR